MFPFATLAAFLILGDRLPVPPHWLYPIRTVAVLAALLVFSRGAVRFRPSRPLASVAVGAVVFAIWIAPDLLWPGYRAHWLFQNTLTSVGRAGGAAPESANPALLLFRVAGSALLVPVVEELFWRAWLMRRLIRSDFAAVPLGAYTAESFWVTAVLFASEHGPYWDVGLLAGIAYGWWMLRSRSLADCILAHAVTNASLAAYVLLAGRWEYWL